MARHRVVGHLKRKKNKLPAHRVGALPGTVVAPPDAVASSVDVTGISNDRVTLIPFESVAGLQQATAQQSLVWINVVGLADTELIKEIGAAFKLHRLSLEDVTNVRRRSKAEVYPDYYYTTCRMFTLKEQLDWEQVSLFFGEGYVITFQERPGDCFEPVRKRLREGRGKLRQSGPDYLAYALLDALVDSYFPLLEEYGERLEVIEDEVVQKVSLDALKRMREIKRELLTIRRTLWPLREAISFLQREDNPLIHRDTQIYLRDCHDHTVQLIDVLESYREMSGSVLDIYLSTVSNQTAEVSRMLTVVATIFIPLTFVAGLYGMNFNTETSALNMPELKWAWGYPACLALMASITIVLVGYFWRKGWLGGSK